MAAQQIIKQRRGSIGKVKDITAYNEAELIIATGSEGNLTGPILLVGKPGGTQASNDYAPISKLYTGGGAPPDLTSIGTTAYNGIPYYDSANDRMYILDNSTAANIEVVFNTASIVDFPTEVSRSSAAAGFGAGSGGVFDLISGTTVDFRANGKNLQITGSDSDLNSHALIVSQSVQAYNINVGHPASNDWGSNLDGSFFSNFTPDTEVSEILRFVAGLLSQSAPSSKPNTKTYSSLTSGLNQTTQGSITGLVPQNSTNADVIYLAAEGFATPGQTIFNGISNIYSNSNLNIDYSSVAGGTTEVSSSNPANTPLFGLGKLDGTAANTFKVQGSHVRKFYSSSAAKNAGDETATDTIAATTLTHNAFNTDANGLTIGKILTVNPAVIPPEFQDGKFVDVHQANIVAGAGGNTWHGESLSSVSASGYYDIETTIGFTTGSDTTFTNKTKNASLFWAPISDINTSLGAQTITKNGFQKDAISLSTDTLSGAPYITDGEWKVEGTASGLFAPLFANSATTINTAITSPTNTWTGAGAGTNSVLIQKKSGNNSLSTAGGTVNSGIVRSSDGSTDRANTTPHLTDIAYVDAIYDINGKGSTFTKSRQTAATTFGIVTKTLNRSLSPSNLDSQTIDLHTAGTQGQNAANGPLQFFGGGLTVNNTEFTESFADESKRRVIGNSATTLDTAWNSSTSLTLGDGGDLQVKPGFLVNPESSDGYFYQDGNYDAGDYKWYLREVDTNTGGNPVNLDIELRGVTAAPSLVKMSNTTDNNTIALVLIFGPDKSKHFDPLEGTGGTATTRAANSDFNPFGSTITANGIFDSVVNDFSGNVRKLDIGLKNGNGQTVNASNQSFWILIRYKGTPTQPITEIKFNSF